MFRGTSAFQHEVGQRPGRPGETKKSRAILQAGLNQLDRVADILQSFGHPFALQLRYVVVVAQDKVHLHARRFPKTKPLAQRLGHDEDVAEKNSGIKVKSNDRLQGHLGRQFGFLDQFLEGMLFSQSPVFRQATSRLAHQPDGRTVHGKAVQSVQHPLAIHGRRRLAFLPEREIILWHIHSGRFSFGNRIELLHGSSLGRFPRARLHHNCHTLDIFCEANLK